MNITPALAAMTAAAAAMLGAAGAPLAWADDVEVQSLGQPGELVDGAVIQHWTVSDLRPSTDIIPFRPVGTLWEATATDQAIAGWATPIVSNLNARAANGETYRVLFGVATPQGVNPSTLPQGQMTTGKIYFDVTGASPDSVVYSNGGQDLLVWVEPPAAVAGSAGGGPASAGTPTIPSDAGAATPDAPLPEGGAATPDTPLPEGSSGTPIPEGSSGTPIPSGSSGTPIPEGSSGTPIPEGTADAAGIPANSVPATTVVPPPPG